MGFFLDRHLVAEIVFGSWTVSLLLGIRFAESLPASFVFGDSLVDAGNNNYLVTISKADCTPNGMDFGMPTGRFTNGRTIVDMIGKYRFSTTSIKLLAE